MNVKYFLVLQFSFLICFSGLAQKMQQEGTSMEQTVEFINKKLGKDYQLELTRKNMQLVINFYKNSVLYKIDRVYLETLDTSKVYFSEEENALILRCRKAEELNGNLKKYRDGCIERVVMDKNIIGAYGRTNLDVGTDKKKIASLQKAFIHLLKLAQDDEYSGNIQLE